MAEVIPLDPSGETPTVGELSFSPPQGDRLSPPTQGGATLSSDQLSAAFYPETIVDVRYDYTTGYSVLPVAAPNGTARRKVKTSAAFWSKVVQFTFERHNDWPDIPAFDTENDNEVLISASIIPAKPLPGPNGLRTYRVSGRYVYELLAPLTDVSLPTSSSPDDTTSTSQNTMPMMKFVPGMIGTSPVP